MLTSLCEGMGGHPDEEVKWLTNSFQYRSLVNTATAVIIVNLEASLALVWSVLSHTAAPCSHEEAPDWHLPPRSPATHAPQTRRFLFFCARVGQRCEREVEPSSACWYPHATTTCESHGAAQFLGRVLHDRTTGSTHSFNAPTCRDPNAREGMGGCRAVESEHSTESRRTLTRRLAPVPRAGLQPECGHPPTRGSYAD